MKYKIIDCVKILVYFIILILQCEARETAENPVIKLEYGRNSNDEYYVEKDKSLKIVIKNSQARYVTCYNYYSGTPYIDKEFPNYDQDSVITIASVTPQMSTRWRCQILQKNHGPPVTRYKEENCTVVGFYFHLFVKGALSANVSINGDYMNFTKMGLNVKHDGEAFFYFVDGQHIELVCAISDSNRFYNYGHGQFKTRLEYFKKNGKIIFRTPANVASQLLRTRLTSKQEMFYIDCICETDSPRREYRYRTYFYEKEMDNKLDEQDNFIRLSVNGLLERDVRKNGSYFEYPPFRYINGEVIVVTCETRRKHSTTPLQFSFDVNNISKIKAKQMDGKNVAIINTSEINLNKKSLTCGFTGIDRNARKGTARITFQSDIADRTVRVFGLPRPNILYEYLSGNTWTTIYEYTANETINMGCALNVVANGNYKFVWNFKGKDLGEYYYTNDLEAIKYSTENFTRTLSGIDDETVIKCIAYEQPSFYKVTEVKLQLKYESNTENLEIEMNKYGSIALILLYLAVCAIFIAILIYSLIFWCRRAKLARLLNNSYNHISDHDASPIPTFPTQWDDNDHYTKIDEDVTQENYSYANNDELLKYPNLRQSHAPSENHYTEIDEYFKAPVKLANKNINQVIHITKNRSKANKENNANENTYDKLMRNGNLKKLNTEKVMVNESLDVKNNDGHQHNYKNINSITNINDSAYAYAYDTRPTAAKSPNRDRSALDYDVPYGTCEVNEENGCYVGPDT